MSSKNIKKDVATAEVEGSSLTVSDEELELINRYTRRPLTKNEVYAFTVVLCDNDVDRDGERFTVESLYELEKLFEGKTGIFDHTPSAKNQTARIFKCEVESLSGKKTKTGDEYFRLKARAYIPKSEKNSDIILAIDSGIVKEVSVGCAADKVLCSICGQEIYSCSHTKGDTYGGRLCCSELVGITDAYEWSFVAVPAQKSAGVIKAYEKTGKEMKMEEILKSIEERKALTLDSEQCEKLCKYIDGLKECAKDGIYYRESLTGEVLRLSAIVQPEISRETMSSIAKGMTVAQLNEFKSAYGKKAEQKIPVVPQLYREKTKTDAVSNGQFRI